jgi:putative OPT family oligopeptide transporter
MRKVFIIGKYKDLPYPEAHATVSVMQTAYKAREGMEKNAWSLVYGGLSGALFQTLVGFIGLFKSPLEHAGILFNRIFYIGGDLSPALIGIGFIIRLRIACCVFIGAFIAWAILLPIFSVNSGEEDILAAAWGIWKNHIRYVGVGAMIVGGIMSIINARQGLSHAIKEIFNSKKASRSSSDKERDISPRSILFCSALCVLCLSYVFYSFTQSITVTFIAALVMIILAFFFTSVANYIVAIVGSSNSPVSGMNIAAVLITGLLLVVLGYSGMAGMVATLGVAAVICCVTCMAGDSCNELKMGHMIGASPFRQQIMLILGMSVSALFITPVLQLLHNNTPGGIGGPELAAPQAALLASLVRGIFGQGEALPWNLILLGVAIGAVLVILDFILAAFKSSFRLPIMPVAVGLYLPAPLSMPMLLGGIISYFVAHDKNEEKNDARLQKGVLFASGFIAGESLTGVAIALLASLGFSRLDLGFSPSLHTIISLAGALLILLVFIWGTKAIKNRS